MRNVAPSFFIFISKAYVASFFLFYSLNSYSASGITYQGRLMNPDGTPVTSSSVQFRLQLRTPGAEDCLLYDELQSVDLSATKGIFSVSLGDGTGVNDLSSTLLTT